MKDIYEQVARLTADGETVATATIVRTKGSTPREVGAKMLVRRSGITGTVGGGCGEADAWRAALSAIESGEPEVVVADLTEDIDMRSRGVCGGIMDILVEPWAGRADSGQIAEVLRGPCRVAIATVVESRGLPAPLSHHLIVPAEGEVNGTLGWSPLDERVIADARAAIDRGEARTTTHRFGAAEGLASSCQVDVFVEVFVPAPTLLICGAGHIAAPLAEIGKLAGFSVVVLDDRPSFANVERFPSADRIVVGGIEDSLRELPLRPDTYVVLVTRGHSYDVEGLRVAIHAPVAYLGMIGSKRRVWAVLKLLHDEGVPIEKLARVHAPIGVDIAGQTPGEIAVSIAAELIKVRRGGKVPSLSDGLRERYMKLLSEGKELG
jgi:xanthine dehydrogenase accessory factor